MTFPPILCLLATKVSWSRGSESILSVIVPLQLLPRVCGRGSRDGGERERPQGPNRSCGPALAPNVAVFDSRTHFSRYRGSATMCWWRTGACARPPAGHPPGFGGRARRVLRANAAGPRSRVLGSCNCRRRGMGCAVAWPPLVRVDLQGRAAALACSLRAAARSAPRPRRASDGGRRR